VLIRYGKQWTIVVPCPPELTLLLPQKPDSTQPVLISAMLQPGKTLAGRLDSKKQITVLLDDDDLASLLPGTATLTLTLPGYHYRAYPFETAPLFAADPDFRAYAEARSRPLPLPMAQTVADTTWNKAGLGTINELKPPSLLGTVAFSEPGRIIAVGSRFGKDFVSVPMSGRGRKLYLRVLAEHEKEQTGLGRITTAYTDGSHSVTRLNASRIAHWRTEKPVTLVWNVIEIDLDADRTLEAIYIETSGKASLALCGASLSGQLRSGAYASLPPRMQKFAAKEPITLFAFDTPTLQGWQTSGKAWGTTDSVGEFFNRKGTSRYFADSKIGGEQATGTILSLPFRIMSDKLTFLANGHSAKNFYALIDATNGNELMRSPVPEKTGAFEKIVWNVKPFRNKLVRFKATDGDDKDAYAWLAFDAITIEP